jgi:hypothetical protein
MLQLHMLAHVVDFVAKPVAVSVLSPWLALRVSASLPADAASGQLPYDALSFAKGRSQIID